MKNKFLRGLIAVFCFMFLVTGHALAAVSVNAQPSANIVYVNGIKTNIAAYSINDNNYCKLRDIAALVKDSEKQFNIVWNSLHKTINLISGQAYNPVGGELGLIPNHVQLANVSTDKLLKDGIPIQFIGYNINNNNYYKLRDVAKSFNIGIKWSSTEQRVDIFTSQAYEEDNNVSTPNSNKSSEIDQGNANSDHAVPIPNLPSVMPNVGEFAEEFQMVLDSCNEEIIIKTIRFKMYEMKSKKPMANIEGQVWTRLYSELDEMLVTTICSDSNGEGSFEIAMPQSLYNKTLAGDAQFVICGKGSMRGKTDATVAGVNYVIQTDIISDYYLLDNSPVMKLPFVAPPHLNGLGC